MEPGRRWRTAGRTVLAAEISAFAQAYDPQALHLDAEWAGAGPFGGLIASGFQTLALVWALWVQTGAFLSFPISRPYRRGRRHAA